MSSIGSSKRVEAVHKFRDARRKAELRSLMAKITGKHDQLLSFEDIRKTLSLTHPVLEKRQDIPLDKIVGSVSRYHDFNRQFYPKMDSDLDRWAKVKELVELKGLDPIEVYQVGDVYFVLDGNHRVSVARQLGAETIEAYVKEFKTDVNLTPDDNLEDVIIKTEHKDLMDDTGIDKIRPDVQIEVTKPGCYREVRRHIQAHQYFMGIDQEKEVSFEDAVTSWVDNVYCPAVKAIREEGIIEEFPGRTETDLYLWLKKHQWDLEQLLKQDIADVDAAQDLKERFGERFWRRLRRIWKRIFGG